MLSIRIESIIEQHKIRDWVNHKDTHNRMKSAIEDYLFDEIYPTYGLRISVVDLDEILDRIIEVARQRDAIR